jgi:hypothetical protein
MVGDNNADKGSLSNLFLLLVGVFLLLLLVEAVGGSNHKSVYMDCVSVVFVNNKTTPETYKTTVLSRTSEERSAIDGADGIVRTLQSRTPFYFIESDMKSYNIKDGNCYGKEIE